MSKKNIVLCDVCQSGHNVNEDREMQLLRHFDDGDGRSYYDHLVMEKIDICTECLEKVYKSGRYLIDNRVQGHGTIEIQGESK